MALQRVLNESASVNLAQLTRLEDGSVVVTTYEYFKTFCTKMTGIKKLRFD